MPVMSHCAKEEARSVYNSFTIVQSLFLPIQQQQQQLA